MTLANRGSNQPNMPNTRETSQLTQVEDPPSEVLVDSNAIPFMAATAV